jgi:hypothetical protein
MFPSIIEIFECPSVRCFRSIRVDKIDREDVVAELILMVNPLYGIMSVPMLNYDWCLALRSVLSTAWVWPK